MAALPRMECRLLVATGVWLTVLVIGLGVVYRYGYAAGPTGTTSLDWPANSTLNRTSNRMAAVMFVHPRCPCTRASLSELERFSAWSDGRIDLCVVFYRPATENDAWAHTSLWTQAKRLPNTTLIIDSDDAIAREFGARTSGYVVAFDSFGHLSFSGGITLARGHEGASDGTAALRELVKGNAGTLRKTITFGCPIFQTETCSATGCSEGDV